MQPPAATLPGTDRARVAGWRLEHTYATLPALFHSAATPTPVRDSQYVVLNTALAAELGLDVAALETPEGAAIFAGNALPEGARPLAQAYAGHQFGVFVGLGDGRAILLGEQITPDGRRVDIQLKGAGQTAYSRRGDGRAALGPMLRELVVSEAMHALGIPTSRSLAVVATGETVHRERPLTGAVLTRVAASHLRVGTFEWAAAHRDVAALRALADYTALRHYPEVFDAENRALALFDAIAERQARLIAQWQLVGFVHGVMNTDNMALSGETIDYGPCAFMDTYDPATVFSSIDETGRYAYGNQPAIAQWNLTRLAEAMLPLIDGERPRAIELATASLERFAERYAYHWRAGMRAKLGMFDEHPEDAELFDALFAEMRAQAADFTNTFRALSRPEALASDAAVPLSPDWAAAWRARVAQQAHSSSDAIALMRAHNPAVIPRNHKVEEALSAAEAGDIGPLERLLAVLRAPYDHDGADPAYASPAAPTGRRYRTFCGT